MNNCIFKFVQINMKHLLYITVLIVPDFTFTDHSKAVLLLWIVFVSYASCWCLL